MRNHCHTRHVVWSKIPQHASGQKSVTALRRGSMNREKKMKQQEQAKEQSQKQGKEQSQDKDGFMKASGEPLPVR